jgi:hypothetical protein
VRIFASAEGPLKARLIVQSLQRTTARNREPTQFGFLRAIVIAQTHDGEDFVRRILGADALNWCAAP